MMVIYSKKYYILLTNKNMWNMDMLRKEQKTVTENENTTWMISILTKKKITVCP